MKNSGFIYFKQLEDSQAIKKIAYQQLEDAVRDEKKWVYVLQTTRGFSNDKKNSYF